MELLGWTVGRWAALWAITGMLGVTGCSAGGSRHGIPVARGSVPVVHCDRFLKMNVDQQDSFLRTAYPLMADTLKRAVGPYAAPSLAGVKKAPARSPAPALLAAIRHDAVSICSPRAVAATEVDTDLVSGYIQGSPPWPAR